MVIDARGEVARYLVRHQSVFLIAPAAVARTAVEQAQQKDGPPVVFVDLADPLVKTRFGLLRAVALALGFPETAIHLLHDLKDFSILLQQRTPSWLVLTRFEQAAGRYDHDLYATLAFLATEARALTLLIQADRALHQIDALANSRLVFLRTIETTIS